jgi:hypothetical protein
MTATGAYKTRRFSRLKPNMKSALLPAYFLTLSCNYCEHEQCISPVQWLSYGTYDSVLQHTNSLIIVTLKWTHKRKLKIEGHNITRTSDKALNIEVLSLIVGHIFSIPALRFGKITELPSSYQKKICTTDLRLYTNGSMRSSIIQLRLRDDRQTMWQTIADC